MYSNTPDRSPDEIVTPRALKRIDMGVSWVGNLDGLPQSGHLNPVGEFSMQRGQIGTPHLVQYKFVEVFL